MAKEQAPDLTAAQEQEWMVGPQWLEWKNHPKTQEILQWIRHGLIGTTQDRWANGEFQTWDANLMAQGGAIALARLVAHIENIKMPENTTKKEDDNDE